VDNSTNQPCPPPLADIEGCGASELIAAVRSGDAAALNELVTLIYPELKRRARWLMGSERPGHTFGASGSELVQRTLEKILTTGGQIFGAAPTEEDLIRMLTCRMRFILVDYARAASAESRPAPGRRADFSDCQRKSAVFSVNLDEVLSTDEILARLDQHDSQAAKALELRFFAGLTNEEAAAAMGLAIATFRRALKRAMVFVKSRAESVSRQRKT
jgi:RNA polymerase sigma factor (TIGR02999 family)